MIIVILVGAGSIVACRCARLSDYLQSPKLNYLAMLMLYSASFQSFNMNLIKFTGNCFDDSKC